MLVLSDYRVPSTTSHKYSSNYTLLFCYSVTFYCYDYLKYLTIKYLKVENDHRSKFSNLSNWKEEA